MIEGRRELRIAALNLACCAVESSDGVEDFLAGQADGDGDPLNVLVVAGTVTRANQHLVVEAYESLPEPRAVVAFGVCTLSGGPYWDSYAVLPGIADLVPITVAVPGCPPTPDDLSQALQRLAGREAVDV